MCQGMGYIQGIIYYFTLAVFCGFLVLSLTFFSLVFSFCYLKTDEIKLGTFSFLKYMFQFT